MQWPASKSQYTNTTNKLHHTHHIQRSTNLANARVAQYDDLQQCLLLSCRRCHAGSGSGRGRWEGEMVNDRRAGQGKGGCNREEMDDGNKCIKPSLTIIRQPLSVWTCSSVGDVGAVKAGEQQLHYTAVNDSRAQQRTNHQLRYST